MTTVLPRYDSDHRVVLVKCDRYEEVLPAVTNGVALLGGGERFCSNGESLLLKPNLLLGDKPEHGTTTHPAVFEAVVKVFKSAGARLSYGDSPGFGPLQLTAKLAGLEPIADQLGVTLADFGTLVDTPNPNGILLKQFQIAKCLS